jgi:hypothetical protein
MQPNNLTALNYDDIKASIKSYLRTRDEFSDYDFEGSTLSYLIDILAYNTYYSAFTANMLINEAFIQSATTRGTIAKLAKLLNYVPKSITSARTCVDLTVQTSLCNGEWPRTATLTKGAVLAGNGFVFHTLSDVTVPVSTTGEAKFEKQVLYEGAALTFEYVVDTFERQRFFVPNEDADISTLRVSVRPNEQSTEIDTYNEVDKVTDLDETSRIYYINESDDMRYEVFFGDGVIGRKLQDGEVVTLEYLVSNGDEANDIQEFTFVGEVEDTCPTLYAGNQVQVTVRESSQDGAERETVESIKYNAPRAYSAQNRAVTTKDYETIVRKVYGNTDSAVAYGGDKLDPPVYGKVYVALKTKSGTKLNNATKLAIAKDLQPYSMASIEAEIVDPDEVYVATKIFTTYDPNKTALVASDIAAKVNDALEEFADQTGLNNFGGSFNQAGLVRAVSLADPAIQAVSVQTVILKYVVPVTNLTNQEKIKFGVPVFDSAPTQTGGTGTGTGGGYDPTRCNKEPVVRGGPFYTADRPGTPSFFEDDGYGNIYSYINDGNTKVPTNSEFGNIDYDTGNVSIGPVAIIGDGRFPPARLDDQDEPTNANNVVTIGNNTGGGTGTGGTGTGTGGTGTGGTGTGGTGTGGTGTGGTGTGGTGDGGTGTGGTGTGGTGTGGTGSGGTGTTGGGSGTGGQGQDPGSYEYTDQGLQVPVVAIPANGFSISPSTPGTIVQFPQPGITVSIIGTPLPPGIPLNSFDPSDYNFTPSVIVPVPIIDGPAISETADGCFS